MDQTISQNEFIDRKGWIVAFGVIELLMGALCLLLTIFLTFVIIMLTVTKAENQMPVQTQIPGLIVYLLGALFFAIMGIGTIMKRRWARALMLVSSWIWLFCGCAGMIGMIIMFSSMKFPMGPGNTNTPEEFMVIGYIIISLILLILYVIIPLIFILFYRAKNVKATFEYYDAKERWTDKVPLPVLGLSMMLAIWSCGMLTTLAYNGTFFLFGQILSGIEGSICVVLLSILYGYLAWSTYHIKIHAWWATLITTMLFFSSITLTFMQVDLMELYETMGFHPQMVEQMLQQGQLNNLQLAFWGGIWSIFFLGFLIYVRKYFCECEQEMSASQG